MLSCAVKEVSTMARFEEYGPGRGHRGADYEYERGYRGPDYERGHRGPDEEWERGSRRPDYEWERGYRGSRQGRGWEQGSSPSYGGYPGGWGEYPGGGYGQYQGGHPEGWGQPQGGYRQYPGGPGGYGGPYQGGYGGGYGRGYGAFYGRGYSGTRSDEEIRNELYDALDEDPQIPYDTDIDVEINDGVVTLTGIVRSRYIKMAAGNCAWMTPGVQDVNNNLTVTGRRRQAQMGTTATGTTGARSDSERGTATAGTTPARGETGTTTTSRS